MAVVTVKPAIPEDCPSSVDGIQNWGLGDDFGLISRCPYDFLNASPIPRKSFVFSVMR
jgi:hypothetical protein